MRRRVLTGIPSDVLKRFVRQERISLGVESDAHDALRQAVLLQIREHAANQRQMEAAVPVPTSASDRLDLAVSLQRRNEIQLQTHLDIPDIRHLIRRAYAVEHPRPYQWVWTVLAAISVIGLIVRLWL